MWIAYGRSNIVQQTRFNWQKHPNSDTLETCTCRVSESVRRGSRWRCMPHKLADASNYMAIDVQAWLMAGGSIPLCTGYSSLLRVVSSNKLVCISDITTAPGLVGWSMKGQPLTLQVVPESLFSRSRGMNCCHTAKLPSLAYLLVRPVHHQL